MQQREFDALTIRRAAVRIRCDERTFRKEVSDPGSVRGILGALIRTEIASLSALLETSPELGAHGKDSSSAAQGAAARNFAPRKPA